MENNFIEKITKIVNEGTDEIKKVYEKAANAYSFNEEKEYLSSLIGKYLVIEKNDGAKAYYGKITDIITGCISINPSYFDIRYSFEIVYEKSVNDIIQRRKIVVNPVRQKLHYFDDLKSANAFIGR